MYKLTDFRETQQEESDIGYAMLKPFNFQRQSTSVDAVRNYEVAATLVSEVLYGDFWKVFNCYQGYSVQTNSYNLAVVRTDLVRMW